MREIASAEVYALVKELQARLSGFYFEKFYELGKGAFLFKLSRQKEKEELLCVLKKTLNLTKYVESPSPISNFYLAARKRMMGFKIEEISQINEDRIVLIKARKGDASINIIIEMFGQGNLVIADGEMKVLLSYAPIGFKDRTIRQGEQYYAPQSASIKLSEISENKIEQLLNDAKGKHVGVASFLARSVNTGSLYIENAVQRAGADPKASIDSLAQESIKEIAASVAKIRDYAESPESYIYSKEGKVIDYSICPIQKYSGLEAKKAGSLQEALDIYYHEAPEAAAYEESRENESSEVKAIEKSIEKQKELLKAAKSEAQLCRKAGEEIFKERALIDQIIEELRRNRRITVEQLQARFPSVKILELNLKDKTVKIRLESQ
ncbi:MAG: NFACT family protein [Candidatus Micrarchaeia archaeon]